MVALPKISLLIFLNFELENNSTSILSNQDEELGLYPNPASEVVHIESKEHISEIKVYDISGRKVLQKSNNNTVNISKLPRGAYMMRVKVDHQEIVKQLIKE